MVFAEAEILAEDIALIALVCVSYGCGLGNNRHLFSTSMLVVLLLLVITGIIDLDRPRRGLVNVAQTSMIRLQSSLLRMSFEGGTVAGEQNTSASTR